MTTHQEIVDATAAAELDMRPQAVPVNMYEASGALVVVAPMPAVMPGDVTVELRPRSLRFFAHVRSSGTREYLLHEWEYGGYERQLELPAGFGGGVEAALHNGQLAVRVLRGTDLREDCVTIHPTSSS